MRTRSDPSPPEICAAVLALVFLSALDPRPAVSQTRLPTLDSGFNPATYDAVYTLAVQPDGKILAGQSEQLLRLNPGGTLDEEFKARGLSPGGGPSG
jgi:hypothetical protein